MKHFRFTTLALFIVLLATTYAQELLYPDDAPVQLLQGEATETFDPGTFLEGVAFNTSGTLFVSGLFAGKGGVWYQTSDGQKGMYPVGGGTLALHPDGTMYAGVLEGDFSDPSSISVSIVRLLPDDAVEPFVTFSKGFSPNGITFDSEGNLFAADSSAGRIWKVAAGKTKPEVWREHDAFKPAGPQGIPGINGIAIHDGAVFTVNSSSGDVFKIPLNDDG